MLRALAIIFVGLASTACAKILPVQCEQSSNCNLFSGGVCTLAPSGNSWCAYPDPSCPSGYVYSTQDVGDGVSGECVAEATPAVDAGTSPDGSGNAFQPPSCTTLPKTCGARGNDDCCRTIEVPGGTVYRSYDVVGDGMSGLRTFPATVSAFRLDKYEVTVGRFRAFLAAGQGTTATAPAAGSGAHAKIAGSGWQSDWPLPSSVATALDGFDLCGQRGRDIETWTRVAGSNELRPMTCITWYQAMAFCIWDGGYLPTQAEFNFAAAGGEQQRAYPWSSPPQSLAIDGALASYNAGTEDAPNCTGDGFPGCSLTDFAEVGTKPLGDGRWGHSDLGGNVSEWLLDWTGYPNPCIDCARVVVHDPGQFRLARGGDRKTDAVSLRISVDAGNNGPGFSGSTGVRCARP